MSSLVLTVQMAARSLGHRLVAENPMAEVVPQVFGAGTWRVLLLALVPMVWQLMVFFQ